MNVPLLSNFIIVAEQVSVVFIIVLLGFFGGKSRMISDEACDGMANIAVNYVTPALIIMAFQREFEVQLVHGFLLTMLAVGLGFAITLVVAHLVVRTPDIRRRNVLQTGCAFGNIGMMSLPLQQALFGGDGVFYCAAGMAMFNIFFWSYCSVTMGGKLEVKTVLRRALLTPGLIGTVIGLTFFFTSVQVPLVPGTAMNNLAALNMPMCMLIIGQRLSKIPFKSLFADKGVWGSAVIRLLIVPLVAALVLVAVGVRGPVAVCIVISLAPPAAAAVNLLAITYDQDTVTASRVVSMQTLVSMITMPVVIAVVYGWLI